MVNLGTSISFKLQFLGSGRKIHNLVWPMDTWGEHANCTHTKQRWAPTALPTGRPQYYANMLCNVDIDIQLSHQPSSCTKTFFCHKKQNLGSFKILYFNIV